MSDPTEPPVEIVLSLDEALDLLSHLEDALTSFEEAGLLSGAVLIDDSIKMLTRKLGFSDSGDADDL